LRGRGGGGGDGGGTKRLLFAVEGTARAIDNGSYAGAYELGIEAARAIHATMLDTETKK